MMHGVNRLQNISWCNFTFTWIDHAHFVCEIPRNEYHFHMTPQYQPVPINICRYIFFPSRFVIRTNLPLPSLYFTKCFIFYVWYVCQFFVYCSDSSYVLWRRTMYFLSCTSIVWNRGYHFTFVCYCVIIDAEQRTGCFYNNLAGTENDLNHVLSTFVDSEHEIIIFCHSQYSMSTCLKSIRYSKIAQRNSWYSR